jgi:hypothetical protein
VEFNSDIVLEILEARTPEQVTEIMLRVLRRNARKVSLVCTPRRTGSRHSLPENQRRRDTVASLLRRNKGVVVFDHTLFLRRIEMLRKSSGDCDREYLRESFHLPLLRSGWIETIYFAFEWRRSVGARWYYEQAKKLGIEIKIIQLSKGAAVK